MRKPRTFNHKPIYIDERKERLSEVVQRARQGQDAPASGNLKGAFASGQRHHRGQGFFFSVPMILSVVVILLAALLLIVFTR